MSLLLALKPENSFFLKLINERSLEAQILPPKPPGKETLKKKKRKEKGKGLHKGHV